MNPSLKELCLRLLNRRIIGKKHTPEKKLLLWKTKYLFSSEKKLFEKEYKLFVQKEYILRVKKMTGKQGDWHISINPRFLKEIYEELK